MKDTAGPSPSFDRDFRSTADRRSLLRIFLALVLGAGLFGGCALYPVRAQADPSPVQPPDTLARGGATRVGVGVHAGWPTGLALLLDRPGTDLDLLAAWRLETFFFAHAHLRLREGPVPGYPRFGYYLGPGLSVHARSGRIRVGGSVQTGARYRLDPFEFYLQFAPRLEVVPRVHLGVTVGAGLYILL